MPLLPSDSTLNERSVFLWILGSRRTAVKPRCGKTAGGALKEAAKEEEGATR